MGKSSPSLKALGALFTPVQADTLALLFGHPDQGFPTSEIIRRIGRGSGAVQRQLAALRDADLVTVTRIGNQRHYQANRRSPIFDELHGLMRKTATFGTVLHDALMTLAPEIALAFVFGSVAAGTARADSDLDLMVITPDGSALDHATLFEALQGAETTVQRRIEPMLMTMSEWRQKCGVEGSFAHRVATGPTRMVIGEGDGTVAA